MTLLWEATYLLEGPVPRMALLIDALNLDASRWVMLRRHDYLTVLGHTLAHLKE